MRRSTLALVCVLSLQSGCFGLHSNQLVQQQYVLSLQPPPGGSPAGQNAAVGAENTTTLLVLQPQASAGRGGEGIAVLRPGQRLNYYSNGRWAGDAPSMVQMLLMQALRERGNFGLVEPDSEAFAARYVLSIDLTQFDARYDGSGPPTVLVSMVCTLGRRSDRSALTTLTVHSSVTAAADRMQPVIVAFEQATSQALWRIADQLTPPSSH